MLYPSFNKTAWVEFTGARRSAGSRQDNRKDSKAKDNKKETTAKDKKDVKTDDDAKDAKTVKPDAKTGRTVNTKITVTIEGDSGADKYDPANPTAEESEDMGTADELKVYFPPIIFYRKNPKFTYLWKIAVINLKYEHFSFTVELFILKMQIEWHTV